MSTHGQVDRSQALAAFADGNYIEPVFGPSRPLVAASLLGILRGIMPTEDDVLRNALGSGNERHILAYRNGRKYLMSAYYEYGAELPPL